MPAFFALGRCRLSCPEPSRPRLPARPACRHCRCTWLARRRFSSIGHWAASRRANSSAVQPRVEGPREPRVARGSRRRRSRRRCGPSRLRAAAAASRTTAGTAVGGELRDCRFDAAGECAGGGAVRGTRARRPLRRASRRRRIAATAGRSMLPSAARIASPQRATSASRTSGSCEHLVAGSSASKTPAPRSASSCGDRRLAAGDAADEADGFHGVDPG